jgi:hypothetical protein
MISLFEEAAKPQEMLQAEGLEFFFVGGVALQIWGQPRLTTEIDVMLEGLADISEEVRRASFQQFTPTISLRVCSPDTLVAMKTIAGRAQDIADLESVIIKQRSLDWAYMDRYLEQIMEYEDISSKIDSLQTIKRQYYRP